jgi:hypothetical protein
MDRTFARKDLPQLGLTTYFLKQSFGDCLVADKSAGCAVVTSALQRCQLAEDAAFMVTLSLVTSACYFGCACPTRAVTLLLPRGAHAAFRLFSCADKVVQISRITDLWHQRAELQNRRLTVDRGAAELREMHRSPIAESSAGIFQVRDSRLCHLHGCGVDHKAAGRTRLVTRSNRRHAGSSF